MNEQRKIEIEEVSEAVKPPKARVGETFERKRDYLAGFLSQKPEEESPVEPGGDLYEAVIDALKEIYDPEIPVTIYDLGLIYDVKIRPENHAKGLMTLTTPHFPVAESLPGEIGLLVAAAPGIGAACGGQGSATTDEPTKKN